ncbi:MAG: hypothetical protein WCI73_08475, partial [Phycisphaerae bacterium]
MGLNIIVLSQFRDGSITIPVVVTTNTKYTAFSGVQTVRERADPMWIVAPPCMTIELPIDKQIEKFILLLCECSQDSHGWRVLDVRPDEIGPALQIPELSTLSQLILRADHERLWNT